MKTYKRGDKVAIINRTLGGKFIVECHAAVVLGAPEDGEWRYPVRIGVDMVTRFIDDAAQINPDEFVARLNAQAGALL